MIRLLELRREKEWSQRETAKRLFVSQGTYNNWENGKTQPSIEQLIALSKLFDVSIDYLITGKDAPLFDKKYGKPLGKAKSISKTPTGKYCSLELENARDNYEEKMLYTLLEK